MFNNILAFINFIMGPRDRNRLEDATEFLTRLLGTVLEVSCGIQGAEGGEVLMMPREARRGTDLKVNFGLQAVVDGEVLRMRGETRREPVLEVNCGLQAAVGREVLTMHEEAGCGTALEVNCGPRDDPGNLWGDWLELSGDNEAMVLEDAKSGSVDCN